MGTSDGKTMDGYCLNLQSPNVDPSSVILLNGTGCNQGYNNKQTFQPDAATGAGAAGIGVTVPGKPVGQLVNFEQFGRCVDVTEKNAAYAYLIAWPCKQAPDKANLDWNQTWELPPASSPGPDHHQERYDDVLPAKPGFDGIGPVRQAHHDLPQQQPAGA